MEEFLVTVTIKKIDKSWWYNTCYKCSRTAQPYGNLYKCSEPTCDYIGKPVQRYKLTMIAGDEIGDTNFIMFGKFVQCLTKKSVVTFIVENPQDFIPNEITRLLEKTFKWNISFTQNTISSSKICFQVNAIVGEINDTDSLLPVTPTTSQTSLLMSSQDAGSSMQRTPQKSVAFPSPSKTPVSLPNQASSATPTKTPLSVHETNLTPQSKYIKNPDDDQITPRKEGGIPVEETIKPFNEPATDAGATHGDDNIIIFKLDANPSKSKDMAATSIAKNPKSVSRKRSRSSPNKKTARKLELGEDVGNEDDTGCAGDTAKPSPSADA